jgi:GNAT superfamily N-acetyltransferase
MPGAATGAASRPTFSLPNSRPGAQFDWGKKARPPEIMIRNSTHPDATNEHSRERTSQYFVRRTDITDRDQLIRLIAMMENVPDAKARYEWLYASNPHGFAQSWIAVEQETGRALGCTSFFPRKVLIDGVVHVAALGGDAIVEPSARRRGIAKALHRASMATYHQGDAEFMYGPPYDANLQALIKAGAHFVGRLENCVRILSMPALHRIPAYYRAARPTSRDLTKLLNHLPRMLLSRFSAPDGSAVPVTLVPVERFDSEFERLFDQCATGYRVLGVRDSEYLNWRYLAAPRRRQIPYAARSSGKLIGMAALEVFRDRAEIIDLFTFPQEAYLDGVLNALIAKAREKGCCVLTATCMSGSLLSRHLRGRGFRAAQSEGFQIAMTGGHPAPANLLDPAAWHYTLADGDMDAAVNGP